MVPITREEKVQWIQKELIPIFDSQLDKASSDEIEEEKIDQSKKVLAEEYLDETGGVLKTLFKLTFALVLIDSFTHMPPQVYGLVFTTTGTVIMLVEANMLGSQTIAARSKDSVGVVFGGHSYLDEEEARRLARNTVITNIGLVWLVVGFLMQIFAIWALPSQTLIKPII